MLDLDCAKCGVKLKRLASLGGDTLCQECDVEEQTLKREKRAQALALKKDKAEKEAKRKEQVEKDSRDVILTTTGPPPLMVPVVKLV